MVFIVFEGIKGSGRKTQIKLLADRLRQSGQTVTVINFPNFESEIARLTKKPTDAYTLSLLYAADRSQHQERIKALLEKGQVVIADRYCYSNFAYQSAKGLPLDWLVEIEKHILKPKIVFLIDVPVDISISRIQQSKIEDFTKKEILERIRSERQLLETVREKYLQLAEKDKESQWHVVDGTKDINLVHEEILNITLQQL